jgi:hypothetical protein
MGSEIDSIRPSSPRRPARRGRILRGAARFAAIVLSLALLLGFMECGGRPRAESRPPPNADAPLPDLEATPIEPVESRAAFKRIRDSFMSFRADHGQLATLPDLADKDEAEALRAMRVWLRRVCGAAIDDVELSPLRFTPFTLERAEGSFTLVQTYRGIDTPGAVLYEVSSAGIIAFIDLYRLVPTNGAPAPIITAAAASDAADATLRETLNAMSKRRDGDRPVLQYGASEELGNSRWDLAWEFRLPNDRFGSPPIVNARTGKVTVFICGTGLPEPDTPPESK